MTTVTRTFRVTSAPAQVLDYLEDFSHAEEWDPGTQSCVRIDGAGPVGVGSRWHNTSKIAGLSTELTYELDQRADDRVVFVGSNDSALTKDEITVRPDGEGSEITYRAVITMKGLGKLAEPLMKVVFEKIGKDTEKSLTEILNALPRAA